MRIAKYYFKIILISVLHLFFWANLYSQGSKIAFDKLTIEAGLSQSNVLSIAQDSMGFMWFGTKDGLNRYDSQQFEVFRHLENDPNSLSSSQIISSLLTDTKGNLWVGTQNGLNKYVSETKCFIRFQNDPKNKKSLSNNTVRSIYEDREGNIWIGTENGLNKLIGNGNFERFFCKGSLGVGLVNAAINTIYQDSKNVLWVGTKIGLATLNFSKRKYKFITYFHDSNNPKTPISNDITSIVEDLNHNIWLGHHFKGLDLYDRANNSFTHINSINKDNRFSSNNIRKILIANDGLLWIATLNGIGIYNPVNHQFTNNIHNPEGPTSLNQNSIYSLFQDRDGSIWVGTYFGGINVYHPNAMSFTIYRQNIYKNSLSSNNINSIVEDQNHNLWIGTGGDGLDFYNRKTGQFTNLKSDKNSISSNLIKSIAIDQNQNLWIVTYNGGVDFYDLKSKKIKNYKLNKDNLQEVNRAIYLTIDNKNRIWVATRGNGLFLFMPKTNQFKALQNSKSEFKFDPDNISYLFQDQNKTLWVATDNGLFYLKDGSIRFKSLKSLNIPFLNNINCINQSKDGIIWFGSNNEGIASYNLRNNSLKFFTINNGLPSNNIASILEDSDQNLWISTDKGLARMYDNKFSIYNINDGLPSNIFNYHSSLLDSKGNLFFGGYNGLVTFKPKDIIENRIAPKIVFTHLRVSNKEININDDTRLLSKSLNEIDELVFSYQQNLFSIDFATLNFVKSIKNKYAYKLQGFEENWNYVDRPIATFTNVPDGTYTLLVKGANNDGVWSTKIAELKIRITPPFWNTWYAYIFYFVLFAGSLYFVLRFIFIRALLKKEQEVNQLKLDFFTNVSHEIRTPLTLILGPLEKLLQETQTNLSLNKQLITVDKSAKRLMRLVNELMDFRKIESGKMKLNITEIDIVPFIKEIFLSFKHIAAQKNLNYVFLNQSSLINVFGDIEQLEKIIFNLLSNAVKFAPEENGLVSVNITKNEGEILIIVSDNGQSIPEDVRQKLFSTFYQAPKQQQQQQRNTGSGIGLTLSRNIARLHHGDLYLENNPLFTTFCLKLKSGYNHFKKDGINNFLGLQKDSNHYNEKDVHAAIDYDLGTINKSINSYLPLILIVEDNEEVMEFLVSALKNSFQTITAFNGSEALQIALDKIPDIIVSDIMMPIMDGFELCNILKTDIRTRHIPVILLTAITGDLFELKGLKTGADVYLTKPVSLKKLELTLQNLLSLQKNMRDKFSQYFTVEPTLTKIESTDEEFLNKVVLLLEQNINNPNFNVNLFASEIGMSTPVFYKKIFALTGLTVNNFIKSVRLKRALQLMQQNGGNVSEIAYQVGFNDPKYFGKEFRKQFGYSPSKFVQIN